MSKIAQRLNLLSRSLVGARGFTLKRTLLRKNLVSAQRGFTLIELLITIAIIGVLSSVFIVSFPAAQKRARDAQRKNDLKQLQTALETYAVDNNGYYPALSGSASDLCTSLGLTTCTSDPKEGEAVCSGVTCGYYYNSDPTGSVYVLYAAFEQPQTETYWELCGSGEAGEGGVVPSGGSCTVGTSGVTTTPPPSGGGTPTPSPSGTGTPAPSPTPTPLAQCNQACGSTSDCEAGLTCYAILGVCRNSSCRSDTDCVCN